ncbi:MAG TPA: DNA repair protein RecN [Nitrospiria bacterium]|jgi:DNA repair protein RecN (Recombination protein N)
MLRELMVQDFAIIDRAQLSLSDGLTVLTGETGAGKSILVDALEVLLGSKAYQQLIRTGCEECRIEAVFEIDEEHPLHTFLEQFEIPCEDNQLLVRRVLPRSGKGRVFINDQMVTLSTLQKIGEFLVDLHGQHDHQSLLQVKNHLSYLDTFDGLISEKKDFEEAYTRFKKADGSLHDLKNKAEHLSKQKEEMVEMIRKIEETNPGVDEEESLLREREILKHSQQLSQWANEAYGFLASDESAIHQTRKALSHIDHIQQIDCKFKEVKECAETALAHLEEVSQQLRNYKEEIEFEPHRLDHIEERLFQLQGLKRKFEGSIEDILKKKEKTQEELSSFENIDKEISSLQESFDHHLENSVKAAKSLSRARAKKAQLLEKHMEKELDSLRMEKCRFKVSIRPLPQEKHSFLDPSGMDQVEFLISSNAGEDLKPLSQVASGGELSRLMLALRLPRGKKEFTRTLIFDEVDAGLGGAVAEVVGEKLRKLSQNFQVLCITHLPQIASQADAHYVIFKGQHQNRTLTHTRRLSKDQRVKEIARMLGGKKITPTTLQHAKEMLGSTHPGSLG